MSAQGSLLDQLADEAPPPEKGVIPPAESRYSMGNLTYMLVFGAIAWVGGKLMEKVAEPAIETVVESGKTFVNSFTLDDEHDEPTDETEDEPPPEDEEDSEDDE